jgi:hypothetical protein
MATKYIINNLANQTISGDLDIQGKLKSNGTGVYRALLSQTGPITGEGATGNFYNGLIVGEEYVITDYVAGDDFSNVVNIQGGRIVTFDSSWVIPVATAFYSGLTGTTSGSGTGATFDVSMDGLGAGSLNIVSIGTDYSQNDTITILGTDIGGTTPENDILITITDSTPFVIETGCVFIATGTTPMVWGNSVLTSAGNIVANVLENTLGDDLVWFNEGPFSPGVYIGIPSGFINQNNSSVNFSIDKTQINIQSRILPIGSNLQDTNLNMISAVGSYIFDNDIIVLAVTDTLTGDFTPDGLYYTPIEIRVNSIQEETPLISIDWLSAGGDSDFDSWDIEIPKILNVTRLTTSAVGYATAHVHNDWESSYLKIELYSDSINDWVTVWTYTLINQNYDIGENSADLHFPGNIDVTFPNITSVSGIRVTSDPGSDQTYHNWETLRFNFFN